MKKIFFELLISPLTVSDNYFVNSIIVSILGFIAFKIAFKIVGDIGARGELGSFLHWIIRLVVFTSLWFSWCIAMIVIRFIMNHIVLLSLSLAILLLIIFMANQVYKHIYKG